MMLVYASIRETMSFFDDVYIQQDGAGPHVGHGESLNVLMTQETMVRNRV